MKPAASRLLAELVRAYPVHVSNRLGELGLDRPDGFEQAIANGESWLRATLEELLAQPPPRQRRGPLEVFQEAMRFPTEALAAAGVKPVARDGGAAAALPGDLYDLAPASSRLLGEEVWLAHLTWGASKARAMSPSGLVGLVSANLMDRARIEATVNRSGRRLTIWDGGKTGFPGAAHPTLALVDLQFAGALSIVEELAGHGVRVIAFGPHVESDLLEQARLSGAQQAMPRSRFFSALDRVLSGSGG